MKKIFSKKLLLVLALSVMFIAVLSGCGQSDGGTNVNSSPPPTPPSADSSAPSSEADTTGENSSDTSSEENVAAAELYVTFGDNGSPFTMNLYDNDTAAAIAEHVGSADWRLPIYNYDGYDNSEVMQFYDIPSRYEIPSNPQSITSETSGVVYYSEPNRIVLFFGDAEVAGEYTQIGYFDATDEFVNAVKDNPVLEDWGNKIIKISADK